MTPLLLTRPAAWPLGLLLIIFLTVSVTLWPSTARAARFQAGGTATIGAMDQDVVAAAGKVAVKGPVSGDVMAAGVSVSIQGSVSEDVLVTGVEVSLTGAVAGDAAIVAVELDLNGSVAGDASILAVSGHLGRGASVAGDLRFSGIELTVDGTVAGDLQVAAGKLILAGTVLGDVDVASGELELKPGARVMGNINQAGPDKSDIPEGAQVQGQQRVGIDIDTDEWDADSGPSLLGVLGRAVALFILGVVVQSLLPGVVAAATADISRQPGRSMILGLAALVGVPLLSVLIMLTIVGIPVAILVLLLYALAFPIGLAVSGFGLAELVARRPRRSPPPFGAPNSAPVTGRNREGPNHDRDEQPGQQLRRFGVFILLLSLIGTIPTLGDLALLLATAIGIGALLSRLLEQRQHSLRGS